MAQLMITGHQVNRAGSIQISGSKNASLPLMAACLLTSENITLKNVPQITDVEIMKEQLRSYGVVVTGSGTKDSPMVLNASQSHHSPTSGRQAIRGATLVLGPLVARFGKVKLYMPGGCNIQEGGRPIDYHINALVQMGAKVVETNDIIELKAPSRLQGEEIEFPEVTVGGTENIVMAACLADGRTTITKAAMEPEVIDLVKMLKNMGANIEVREDQREIIIDGRRELLSGTTHMVIPDRIEAGSYAIAAGILGGPLLLKMDPGLVQSRSILVPIIEKLNEAGITTEWKPNGLEVTRSGVIRPVNITTGPYPAFPTDLLPQWVTLMTQANRGVSVLEDTIYDNRFAHVPELEKMGAKFTKKTDGVYNVHGGRQLQGGKHLKAKDLRGGMALVLAALAAEGPTVVKDIQHVHRGYADLKAKLVQCGATFEQLPPTRSGHSGGR